MKHNAYTMSDSEMAAITQAVADAANNACIAIHEQQCSIIDAHHISRAARVESILQLAALSSSIERAAFTRINRINQQ